MGQFVDYNAWVSLLITDAWVNKLRELITGGKMSRETIFIIGQNNFQTTLAMFPLSADFFFTVILSSDIINVYCLHYNNSMVSP